MPLTPQDIQNKRFSVVGLRRGGYDEDEVDKFLDDVEEELRRLIAENTSLRQAAAVAAHAAPAQSPLAIPPPPAPAAPPPPPAPAPAAPPMSAEDGGDAALKTLMLAQKTADEAIAQANREAEGILHSARLKASALEHEAQAAHNNRLASLEDERKGLEAEIAALRGFEREFRTRLRAYLESSISDLDARPSVEPAAPAKAALPQVSAGPATTASPSAASPPAAGGPTGAGGPPPGVQQPGVQQPGVQQPAVPQPGVQQPGAPAGAAPSVPPAFGAGPAPVVPSPPAHPQGTPPSAQPAAATSPAPAMPPGLAPPAASGGPTPPPVGGATPAAPAASRPAESDGRSALAAAAAAMASGAAPDDAPTAELPRATPPVPAVAPVAAPGTFVSQPVPQEGDDTPSGPPAQA